MLALNFCFIVLPKTLKNYRSYSCLCIFRSPWLCREKMCLQNTGSSCIAIWSTASKISSKGILASNNSTARYASKCSIWKAKESVIFTAMNCFPLYLCMYYYPCISISCNRQLRKRKGCPPS